MLVIRASCLPYTCFPICSMPFCLSAPLQACNRIRNAHRQFHSVSLHATAGRSSRNPPASKTCAKPLPRPCGVGRPRSPPGPSLVFHLRSTRGRLAHSMFSLLRNAQTFRFASSVQEKHFATLMHFPVLLRRAAVLHVAALKAVFPFTFSGNSCLINRVGVSIVLSRRNHSTDVCLHDLAHSS